MNCLTDHLRRNVTAQWYADCLAQPAAGRRVDYVRVLEAYFQATGPSAVPGREAVVAAVGTKSSSTLYSLFGPRAPKALLNQHPMAVSDTQHYEGGMDGLVVETKVWSYWPLRQGWLDSLDETQMHDRRFVAETLVRVVAMWASEAPRLAASLGCAPPLLAVEDMMIIAGPAARLDRVGNLLTRVVELATHSSRPSPLAVLHTVYREVAEVVAASPAAEVGLASTLAVDLVAVLARIEYFAPLLAAHEHARLADEIAMPLRATLRMLGEDAR